MSEENNVKQRRLEEKIKQKPVNTVKSSQSDSSSSDNTSSSQDGISEFLANISEENEFALDEFQKIMIQK